LIAYYRGRQCLSLVFLPFALCEVRLLQLVGGTRRAMIQPSRRSTVCLESEDPRQGLHNIPIRKAGVFNAASRKGYERYFLTIVCDSLGVKSRETAAEFEPAPNLLRKTSQRSTSTNKSGRSASVRGADSSRNNQPSVTVGADLGVIDSNRPQTEAPRAYCAKQRYFLIYDEVCSDLDQDGVTSLQDVFVGLRGCLIGASLTLLHWGYLANPTLSPHAVVLCGLGPPRRELWECAALEGPSREPSRKAGGLGVREEVPFGL
jgi:hypothetical protein